MRLKNIFDFIDNSKIKNNNEKGHGQNMKEIINCRGWSQFLKG